MSMNKKSVCEEIIDIKNYTTVPNLVWDLNISGKAKIVWIYLLSNASHFDPSNRFISEKTGLCRLSVQNALNELSVNGLIDIIPAIKRGKRTRYRMRGPSEWIASIKKRPNDLPEEAQIDANDGLDVGQELATLDATGGKAMGRNNINTTRKTTQTQHASNKACSSSAEFSFEERARVSGSPKRMLYVGPQTEVEKPFKLSSDIQARRDCCLDESDIERAMEDLNCD